MSSSTIIAILIVAVAVVIGPIATIWSLNTVFSLGIPYTIWTWLGVAWLQILIYNGARSKQ